MKKYHVYGLGNALVDMTFEVESNFFEKNKIEKGLMTLISTEKANNILNLLKDKKYRMTSGGSAANAMVAIAQLGGNSFYSCKIANDDIGLFFANDLKNKNVHIDVDNLEQGSTGKCIVMITKDADRTMYTHLGITETFSTKNLNLDAIKNSKFIYIEGYLVPSDTAWNASLLAAKTARENGIKIALTFSDPNMIKFFRNRLDDIIDQKIDLIFCNEKEALEYTQKSNIQEAAHTLQTIATTFCITLGPKGSLVFDSQNYIPIDPIKVKAIDTNGAGDIFAGSFLYGITQGYDFKTSAILANRCSAELVSKVGPRLKTCDLQKIKEEVLL